MPTSAICPELSTAVATSNCNCKPELVEIRLFKSYAWPPRNSAGNCVPSGPPAAYQLALIIQRHRRSTDVMTSGDQVRAAGVSQGAEIRVTHTVARRPLKSTCYLAGTIYRIGARVEF